VGVGASAGGLEAFTQLLDELPSDTGMAFVLIQHLDPTHTSFLADALTKATKMSVAQAQDGESIKPNHIYVIPPDADIAILHGLLTLLPRKSEARKLHLPIDFFLRSLAQERGNHAIGVILSGTASDGTEGLRAIKAEDGITLVQDPNTAKFDGMPRSALNAGVVDYSLSLPELARELVRLSTHPYVAAATAHPPKTNDALLNHIYALLRNSVGVDFSEYKAPSFERRLARRMALRKVDSLQIYLELLQDDPKEVRCLYEDILIHVTSFFRDPEVFESLKTRVFPDILKRKSAQDPIRIWVAGCSTGEEVYSLAITLLECLGDSSPGHPIQIFGSDIGDKAIEKARAGLYSDSAMRDVTDERRRQYFAKVDSGYRINKMVRDLCIFVRHDLARDPPFSKLDLVSCRNVLIYFGQALQKRILPTFHYSLNPSGFLLLGHTESIAGFGQLFSPVDHTHKVFSRTMVASALNFAPRSEVHPVSAQRVISGRTETPRRSVDLARQLERHLLASYAPPGALINDKMEILQFSGDTGAYLRPAPGEPQNSILKMAREGLAPALRSAVAKAKKDMSPVRVKEIQVGRDGSATTCDLVVGPFTAMPETKEHLFVVLFEEVSARTLGKSSTTKIRRTETPTEKRRIPKLERELAATKEYLQSLVDDRDRTNDDLNAANEELVSGNEELQSMNEELETAKEELQSTNEELTTVNDELHTRNHEVAQINGDLMNILSTVDVPILILDGDRRIRRFTPKARSILNVLPSDVGRPLDDIKSNLQVGDLDQRVATVIESNEMYESEVQDRDGKWYRMQIRPYKTIEQKIDGATLSLVDIDTLKHHLARAERAKKEAQRATRAKDDFLATLSHEIRTPLSSMMLRAQMLRRRDLEPAEVKRAGEVIERAIKMQVQLIDDLLDVSRIVTGMLRIESRPVDLCSVIKAAIEELSAPAERKMLTLKVILDDNTGAVLGDPIRLQQVVANLLTNAIKFSSDHGQVTVRLDRVDRQARIEISDSGSGIDPDFLPYIFNRFAQEDGSTVRRHGGLGLGLAIVRHLVEAHGGIVQGESAGKGKGAAFSVLLPLMGPREVTLENDGPAAEGPRLNDALMTSQHGLLKDLRILVVDDDMATRDAVAEMLGQTGATVMVASCASEAIGAVQAFEPEVLLCDIAMPGEDGYSLLRKVRALGGRAHIPAAAITALAGEEDRRRTLAAGFQMHLVKPVDIDRLAQAVAELSHRMVDPVVEAPA
jgi:chemotaxis methyl-accepting protein methylase/signal transduction histidine kinase/chemotaxis response regulator CheB